ncbi:unnamed protein product [Didymodactylos carnosus]|uniref:Uncharacterized protein n=1 Tax=Didymodactylos carnosus TaxID=1234261 RepID=A0A814T9N8_9BILA|nr:unnamed protein product [Didymodactylos carnosus]CAF3919950.1 unnamed protein product [Didymodactylos carnosus]
MYGLCSRTPLTMAEQLVNSLISTHLSKLPKFGGKVNENVIEWITYMADEFKLAILDDSRKLSMIHTYLYDDASDWFINNMTRISNWSTFVCELQKVFSFSQQATIDEIDTPVQCSDKAILHSSSHAIAFDAKMDSNIKDQSKVVNVKIDFQLSRQNSSKSVEFLEQDGAQGDTDTKEEQDYELLIDKKENPDYSTTTSVELDNIVLLNMGIMDSGENNFESGWPDGDEPWFIHDRLQQRLHFIPCKHEAEKDAETLDDFLTTSLHAKALNVAVDDNEGLPTTSVLQTYENIDNIIYLLFSAVGKHQLIDKIDMTTTQDIFSMCQDNDSTNASTCLRYMMNGHSLWCNWLPYKTNDWEWFRTFAVP